MKQKKQLKANTIVFKNIEFNVIQPCDFSKISQIDIKFTENAIAGPKSTNEIFELLKTLTNLENLKLILRKNSIGFLGLQQISKALKDLHQLKSFFLQIGAVNNIGSAGFSSLSQSISSCSQLTNLNLYIESQNSLKSNGIIALAKKISSLHLLQNFQIKINDNQTHLADGFLQLLINLSKCKQLQNITLISIINEDKLKLDEIQNNLRNQCLKEIYKFTPLFTKGHLQIGSSQMKFDKTKKVRLQIQNFLDYDESYSKVEIESFMDIEELKYHGMTNSFEFLKNLIDISKNLKFLDLDYVPRYYQIISYLPQMTSLTYLNLKLEIGNSEDAQLLFTQVMLCKNLQFLNLTGVMGSRIWRYFMIPNEFFYSFKNIIYLNIMFYDNNLKMYTSKSGFQIQKKFLKQKRLVKYQANWHIYNLN